MSTDPNPNPEPDPTPEPKPTPPPKDQTFTQADVDRIVGERVKRAEAKFSDYDALKARAGEATTLEERVADIERQASDNESRAVRAEIANAKGLTSNQAKRLVGGTRQELEADADELLADLGAQKKQGNISPREGNNSKAAEDGERAFVRDLFKSAD